MATANAAVLTKDPRQKIQDPSDPMALLLASLGGTNPAISQPLADIAFADPGAGIVDPSNKGGIRGLQPAAIRALEQQQFQQFLRGQFAGAQQELRGVGEGPAAEQQSTIEALLNFFPRRELIERGAIRVAGGPGRREDRVRPLPVPKPAPSTRGVRSRTTAAPAPEPGMPETPAFIRDLQKALDARRTAERDIGARKAALQTLPPQLGESREALERRLGVAPEFASGEQAFRATLLGERRKRSGRDVSDEALAQQALQAFASGDEATSARIYKQLAERTVSNMRLNSKKAGATMSAHLDGTARTIMRFLGESEDATTRNAMIAQTPPKILEAAKQMAIRGSSSQEVEAFLSANSPQVQKRQQQAFARRQQQFQESQSQALFGIIQALLQARAA